LPHKHTGLEDSPPIDRTSINSWEDVDFVEAVHATGRRKLIFCALWTEVCMAFAALDALREGYQVYATGLARRRCRKRCRSAAAGGCCAGA